MQIHSCMLNASLDAATYCLITLIAIKIEKTALNWITQACHIYLCGSKSKDIHGLKDHITEVKTVTCRFRHCDKTVAVEPTFTSRVKKA